MLGTALSSGLQTFNAVDTMVRRRQLHDLQVEGATLRNHGLQRQNEFYDETYDMRVDQQRSNTARAEWQAETDRLRMELQEQLNPLSVTLAEEKVTGQQLANVGQGHQNRRLAADATVAERTMDSRIDESISKASKAEVDALEARRSHAEKVAEGVQNDLWNMVNAAGGVPDEVLHDPGFQYRALGLLNTRYRDLLSDGQEVVRIGRQPETGQFVLLDNNDKPITENRSSDPDDPVMQFSEAELYSALFGDNAGEAAQGQAEFRVMDSLHAETEAGRLDALAKTREADRSELETLTLTLAEHGPALADFNAARERLGEIDAEIQQLRESTAGRPNMDAMGVDPTGNRIAALQQERSGLESTATELVEGLTGAGVDPQHIYNPDQLQERIQTLGDALQRNTPGGQTEQGIRADRAAGRGDARFARQRGLSADDYAGRLQGSGDTRFSLESQRAARDHHMAPVAAVDELIDSAMKGVDDIVSQANTQGGKDSSNDAVKADIRNDINRLFAVNPDLMFQIDNDREAKVRLGSVINDAAALQARTGRSAAITIASVMRDDDPAITEAMHGVLEDNDLLRNHQLSPEEQLVLAEMVGQRMRSGRTLSGGRMSSEQAKRLATQEFLSRR